METPSFNQEIKNGNLNPFNQNGIIICSYIEEKVKSQRQIKEMEKKRNTMVVFENKLTQKLRRAVKGRLPLGRTIAIAGKPLSETMIEGKTFGRLVNRVKKDRQNLQMIKG